MFHWTVKVIAVAFFFWVVAPGCVPACVQPRSVRALTGTALNAETMQPIVGATIEIQSFTGGDANASGSTEELRGRPPTPEDGTFKVDVLSKLVTGVCSGSFPVYVPELPIPDELRVTVIRDACEQELTIAIDDTTATHVVEGGRVTELQLVEPILVPACPTPSDEAPATTP